MLTGPAGLLTVRPAYLRRMTTTALSIPPVQVQLGLEVWAGGMDRMVCKVALGFISPDGILPCSANIGLRFKHVPSVTVAPLIFAKSEYSTDTI